MIGQGENGGGKGQRRFIDVDGVRTSYFEAGAGEPMLLIHGGHFGLYLSSAIAWTPIFPFLVSHFRLIAVDKLGTGFTDNPARDEDYAMEAVVRHLRRFIEELGLEAVHLAGQSRGALPAARIAIDHPRLVKSVTLFNSNTLAPGDPAPKVPDIPDVYLPDGPALDRALIREKLLAGYMNPDHIGPELLEDMVDEHLEVALLPKSRQAAQRLELLRGRFVAENQAEIRARPGLGHNSGTGWWLARMKDKTTADIKAGRLKTATQIVWGAADSGAEIGLGVSLFELLAPAADPLRLHLLARCGHHPFAEFPAEVSRLMVDFAGATG